MAVVLDRAAQLKGLVREVPQIDCQPPNEHGVRHRSIILPSPRSVSQEPPRFLMEHSVLKQIEKRSERINRENVTEGPTGVAAGPNDSLRYRLGRGEAVPRIAVDVMLKREILDPQGQAVERALPELGF